MIVSSFKEEEEQSWSKEKEINFLGRKYSLMLLQSNPKEKKGCCPEMKEYYRENDALFFGLKTRG
jgi:hypothetical protein